MGMLISVTYFDNKKSVNYTYDEKPASNTQFSFQYWITFLVPMAGGPYEGLNRVNC